MHPECFLQHVHNVFQQNETPRFSRLYGGCFPVVPNCILEMNPLEARLVTPKLVLGSIYQLWSGGRFGLKEGMVGVAAKLSKIHLLLPRTYEERATLDCNPKGDWSSMTTMMMAGHAIQQAHV